MSNGINELISAPDCPPNKPFCAGLNVRKPQMTPGVPWSPLPAGRAELAQRDVHQIVPDHQAALGPAEPVTLLTRLRQQWAAALPQVPEAVMQAAVHQIADAAAPALAPPAPASDLAIWQRTQQQYRHQHPAAPEYAPPVYLAYADAHIKPATATPYRFTVAYHYDATSGALTWVTGSNPVGCATTTVHELLHRVIPDINRGPHLHVRAFAGVNSQWLFNRSHRLTLSGVSITFVWFPILRGIVAIHIEQYTWQ